VSDKLCGYAYDFMSHVVWYVMSCYVMYKGMVTYSRAVLLSPFLTLNSLSLLSLLLSLFLFLTDNSIPSVASEGSI
jgi:hypothetical protein